MRDVFPSLPPWIHLNLFGNQSRSVAPDHPRVRQHGYVESLDQVWSTCDFMICPILSGGGVCVKLAEAVHHGMPLLATRFASRGLPLDPDPAIILQDDAQGWVEFLISEAARQLGGRVVSERISAQFNDSTQAPVLSEFLCSRIGS